MVTCAAILNPCKSPGSQFHNFISSTSITVMTSWDVKQFADRVKNSQVKGNGGISSSDLSLSKYFPQANFDDLKVPAVITDCHGLILAWHLPGVLTESRVVFIGCLFHFHIQAYIVSFIMITAQQSLVSRRYWKGQCRK